MLDKKLKILFYGTPDFAVASLNLLCHSSFNIIGVVTAPDKPAGRGYKLSVSPIKIAAQELKLPVFQPDNLKSQEFHNILLQLKPDIQIVVAFRMLPSIVWDFPPLGTFNLHASLLPNYRGAAPINWVLINGEKETGVTTFKLKHQIDTGDIALSKRIEILANDNFFTLYNKLKIEGAKLLVETLIRIINNQLILTKQSFGIKLNTAPKIVTANKLLNYENTILHNLNIIRAFYPSPGAFSYFNNKILKVFEAYPISKITNIQVNSVQILDNRIIFSCYDGDLVITSCQLEGKKRLDAQDFLRGL